MSKILALVLGNLIAASYATPTATLIINNATDDTLRIATSTANCIVNPQAINQQLSPVRASNVELMVTSERGAGCQTTAASGEINFYAGNGELIANSGYSITKQETHAWVNSYNSQDYIVQALSDNTYLRNGGKNLIIISITLAGKKAGQYSDWMGQIQAQLQNKTLASIVLPGTHDSLSSDLNAHKLCTADPSAAWIDLVAPFGKNFAQAQYLSMQEQLERGIRYFDIRLCHQDNKNFVSHSLISNNTFESYLTSLPEFLIKHPHEIIVLDLQHVYGYDKDSFSQLLNYLKETLGTKIISHAQFDSESTVGEIWSSSSKDSPSIIILLPDSPLSDAVLSDPQYSFAWPHNAIQSPWPNTTDINYLLNYASQQLSQRDTTKLWVSQLQLTPSASFIFEHLSYSLQRLAYQNLAAVYDWQWQQLKSAKLNILIRDWSDGFDGTILAIQANSL